MIFMGGFNTKCMYQDAILENIVHQLFWFLESSPTNISDLFFQAYSRHRLAGIPQCLLALG